jgi:hypothetical protein
MSQDRHDDDVIVISEEDVSYDTEDENDAADPADASAHDDLAANDQATQAVPSETGRFGTMTAAGDAATPGDVDTDPDTHPVTEPVTPASSSYGDSAYTPGYSGLTPADAADPADPADPAASVDDTTSTSGTGSLNGSGTGTGSAIPMPGADAPSAATPATPVTPVTPAIPVTPVTPATPAASEAAPDSNWPQIQSLFVDDPQAAVRQAADVAGGALAALVAAANNREQTLRDSWQGDSTGTEELRTALRDYRDLAGRLSALSKDL